jgi:hypothetical protein
MLSSSINFKIPTLLVNPQLKGHLRGALNVGATIEEVRAVRCCLEDM